MKPVLWICFLLLLSSCMSKPQAIDYGADECHRCKMIISDGRFGAELVTKKGKAYKYDAIECLIPALLDMGESHYSHILVTDYSAPKIFIPAQEATFLVSEGLPSPMGGSLSAFAANENVQEALERYGGETLTWLALKDKYRNE